MSTIRTTTVRSVTIAALSVVAGLAAIGCSTDPATAAADPRPAESTTSTGVTTTAPPRPSQVVDALIAVDERGARMHLVCSGSGPSTVLLLSGFEGDGTGWDAVTPAVTPVARVCAHDRFGTGASDAPPRVQTFATQAEDLHRLLELAGEPGPYTVVGHSFGGSEAVSFAARYRDEVTGLMLLDASPTDWPTAACAVPNDGSPMAEVFRDTCELITVPDRNAERLDGRRAFVEVAAVDTLGDLPMRVLTRAEVVYDGLAPAAAQELARVWHGGQDRWARLSTGAEVVAVPNTSHYIQDDQPGVVVDGILTLLDDAR